MQCTELGGTERAALQFMTGLQRQRHVCRVFSLNPLGRMAPLLRKAGIPAEGLAYRGMRGVRTFPGLYSRLRREQCDALIMTGLNLMAMLALGRLGGERRVLAVHHHHTGEKPDWQWRLMYRMAHRCFRAITFPSDFIRREAEILYPPIIEKTHTLRNPIDIPPIATVEEKAAARLILGIPPQAKVIGNAGWLIPRKRFDIFLRVTAELVKQHRDLRCVIAGDGPERAQLERLARELDIVERVHWLGWREDMQPFYQSLDCLLFNSDWEALSMTALEALSHGVPLVASIEHGGLSEIVADGEDGILFNRHDVDVLAAAVRRSLGAEGARLARAGRARVERHCNMKSAALSLEALLLSD